MAFQSMLVVVTALALLAEGLSAQTARDPGGMIGTVRTADTGRPLGAALVTLLGTPHRTLTDSSGEFRLIGVAPGRYSLQVRVIGHEPQSVSVMVDEKALTRVSVELAMQPIALLPVEVNATRVRSAHVMRGFYERMAKGRGHFLTRADIEARHPRTLAQTLEMVPGIRIYSKKMWYGGMEAVIQTGRNNVISDAYDCQIAYFLDGRPFRPASIGADTEIRPADIEGIEVYLGPASIPPQFNQAAKSAGCGVIVIWTRFGSEGRIGRPSDFTIRNSLRGGRSGFSTRELSTQGGELLGVSHGRRWFDMILPGLSSNSPLRGVGQRVGGPVPHGSKDLLRPAAGADVEKILSRHRWCRTRARVSRGSARASHSIRSAELGPLRPPSWTSSVHSRGRALSRRRRTPRRNSR